MTTPKNYTVTQAAKALGLTRQGVWHHIYRRKIKAKPNEFGHYLISATEIKRVKRERAKRA